MKIKRAILQVADTGPLESLVVMLQAAGIECFTPDDELKGLLRRMGCDTVLDISGLVSGWGYDQPIKLPLAGIRDMVKSDVLYVDVKAHRNGVKVWSHWPNLRNHTLWYRINGGEPQWVVNHRGDHGNELDPPCPILTPNQWYQTDVPGEKFTARPWGDKAYCCWPPFHRIGDYYERWGRKDGNYDHPICLIHNIEGWGYRDLIGPMRNMGVRCYGAGSPDGLLRHSGIPKLLSNALCMVHLKSNDAPGYSLYEALAAACPVVCTRRLIWRCKMDDLLIPGVTCMVFDRETHEGLTQEDISLCTVEVASHLESLKSKELNRQMGMAGRARLLQLMWRVDRDLPSLQEWLQRMYQ